MLRINEPLRIGHTNEWLPVSSSVYVERLTRGQEPEILAFLGERPIHTVAMASLIRDNGLDSRLNRGTFYACRDMNSRIEGVALIGHATLLETASHRALESLARLVQGCPDTFMLMGEEDRIEELWQLCSSDRQRLRVASREALLELHWPIAVGNPVANLRLARPGEIETVMPIQARMAFDESGVDPFQTDPDGFRERCARRIRQGRTWLCMDDDALIFKAELISYTPEVIYLEGVWQAEDRRGSGIATDCLLALSRKLLTHAQSICVLVNEKNTKAISFYRNCGYLFRATYATIFLTKHVQ
ncbi:MAG: GNAT family N-acetyltransferase [Pyrinomonadaceae bacterium]